MSLSLQGRLIWRRSEQLGKDRQSGTLYLFFNYIYIYLFTLGFPGGSDGKESACNAGGGHGNPLQYSCLENPRRQRSLMGYSPWSRKESDTTERLSFIYLLFVALGLQCGMHALDCSVWTSFVAVHGFNSCRLQASLVVPCNSLVAVCGLSCPAAHGILVPWQGIKPTSPFIARQILNHCASTEVPGEGPFKSLGPRFRTAPAVLYLRPVLPWTLALQGAQHKNW